MAASWVLHVSTSWPSVTNLSGLNGPAKQKPDTSNGPLVFPSEVVSTKKLECDAGSRSMVAEESWDVHCGGNLDPSESNIQYFDENCRTTVIGKDAAPPTITSSVELNKQSCGSGSDKDGNLVVDGKLQSLCSKLSISVHTNLEDEYSTSISLNSSSMKPPGNQCSQLDSSSQQSEPMTSAALMEATTTTIAECAPKEDDSLGF
ncbi:hypothetical protein F0562_016983 [Nyssa sinensis]|uniref:Uncharacterized protein n=1 Tax=Nyssa sinensis TaxID=561372 RepID=A0A5J4ZGP5_9ASTE|nr:hypothetical protein F0562_016983 [Nyssa sinensis]